MLRHIFFRNNKPFKYVNMEMSQSNSKKFRIFRSKPHKLELLISQKTGNFYLNSVDLISLI